MKVKTTKNEYGWMRVHCPFCIYVTRESGGDKLRWVKNHIFKMAKNEAFDYFIDKETRIDHLNYVIKHTNNEKVIKVPQRVFDEDLKIEK